MESGNDLFEHAAAYDHCLSERGKCPSVMKGGDQVIPSKNTDPMESLINPNSIAIVGASEKTMYGRGVYEALKSHDYKGKIFLINPKRDEILGTKCYKALSEIPEPIDLVVIIVGRKSVLKTLQGCVSIKAKGALIITAGFREADEEGKGLEESIREFASSNPIRIWGPNCAGYANFRDLVIATLVREEGREFLPGKAGLVSQSGALMMSLVGVARDKGLGLNFAISTGNEVDLESVDFMEYMVADPSTKAVAAFVEGFKDVRAFSRVAERALEEGKPLCVLKVGRSELGEKAAASHTGSITGSDKAYETLFREKGVLRATDTDELLEMAKACTMIEYPKSKGIAILTSSGGTGSMSADLCADYGLDLSDLSENTSKKLANLDELLTFERLSNPIDVRGQGIRAINKVLPIVLDDENFGVIVIAICFSSVGKIANEVATLVRDAILGTKRGKPVIVLWIGRRERLGGSYEVEEGYEILERANIPVFSAPGKCFKFIKKMFEFKKARDRYHERGRMKRELPGVSHRDEVRRIAEDTGKTLHEFDGKKIISLYEIPVTREKMARSPEEATKVAEEIGWPVALKAMSRQIVHKTDAGIVRLNIFEKAEVEKAYREVWENAGKLGSDGKIEGVLVQEMIPSGVEVILGMTRDPQFGPLILFGIGGIFVEILKDIAFRLPPISEDDAREMIEEIKGHGVLRGDRKGKPYDIDALAEAMAKFSYLCMDVDGIFKEIEINPLIVGERGKGVKVVDSLLVRY